MIIEGGIVRAYSPQGALLWEYLANGKLLPFITRTWEGTSYICRTNGVLIALNHAGLELWKVNVNTPISHAVIIGWDGRIFAPLGDKIACYNNTGRPLWTKELGGSIVLPPVLDKNGGLLTALDEGKLLQINAFGKIKETPLAETPAFLIGLFPSEDDTATNGILVINEDGGIVGGEGWVPHLGASPLAACEYNGRTAIALSNGEVSLFSNEGERIWSVDGGVSGERSAGAGIVLLYDERGVYVLGLTKAVSLDHNGSVKWSLSVKNAAIPPVFSDEGVLYLSGSDWLLYAYRMEDAGVERLNLAPQQKYGLGELPQQKVDYYKFNDFVLSLQFDAMREKLQKGELEEDEPVFTTFLKEASASVRNSLSIPKSNPPVHLQRRIEAIKLLELFGSEEMTLFLADLFMGEVEPLIRIATASAIGSIGVDREGAAMRTFARAAESVSDERVLTSIVKAVGALCRRAGTPAISEGVPILETIGARADAPRAQRQAIEELKNLQR
jgi:outer membrane protein assembly factor BamB